jgi:hypothetical protein
VDKFMNESAVQLAYSEYGGEDLPAGTLAGKYRYDPDNGISSLIVTLGPLMIESVAQGPENSPPYDEAILKQAVVEGTKAAIG